MGKEKIESFITYILNLERTKERNEEALGYITKLFAQATIPCHKPGENFFQRENGNFRFTIMGEPGLGVPYGIYPRLILAWITTEVVKNRSKDLILEKNSLRQFMNKIGMQMTGGKHGTTSLLENKMLKFFSSHILCEEIAENADGTGTITSDSYYLWRNSKKPNSPMLWGRKITLGETFFKKLIENPIPINLIALGKLRTSSMALDLYYWLSYKLSDLNGTTTVSWETLKCELGTEYPDNDQGRREFKWWLLKQLKKVVSVCENATVNTDKNGLILSRL